MNTFTKLGSIVFGLIFVLHVLRLAYGWEAQISGWVVPLWLSSAAIGLSAVMAWGLWKESK